MKQTAVEWLESQLKKIPMVNIIQVFQQAKAMERDQIVNAFKEGLRSPYHQDYAIVTQEGQEATKSGQYYQQTYGKQ